MLGAEAEGRGITRFPEVLLLLLLYGYGHPLTIQEIDI